MKKITLTLSLLLYSLVSRDAHAARVVAYSDEWLVSNTGYTNAGGTNAQTFALNLATFLKGGAGAGNFLIYSDSFGLTESSFLTTLTSAGHTVTTINSSGSLLPADLSAFDGIFLSGSTGNATAATLTNYVNADNGVFIAAGNSYFPNVEANRWNTFLANFGLGYVNTYNGIQGNVSISNTHQIFNGVSQLYYDNGNNVFLTGGVSGAALYQLSSYGDQLFGIYDSAAPVPEPATIALISFGLLGGVARSRRRKA